MSKSREIVEELRGVLLGRVGATDAFLPPLIFVAVNAIAGLRAGASVAICAAIAITAIRLLRGRPIRFAVSGLAGTVVAVAFAAWSGSAEAYFVPGIITGGLSAFVAVISIAVGRPMVAWTSSLARRWPLDWYWHPQVRPAYRDVTWVWAAFFASRTALQVGLAREGDLSALAATRIIGGWPALIVLLVVTYLYGAFRLSRLGGPSVEEFRAGDPPPWSGQRRGF